MTWTRGKADVSGEERAAVPARYQLMLPPGWTHLPLRAGTGRAIASLLDRQFASLGRDRSFPLRRALTEDLRDLAVDARRVGGLDLYLMTGAPAGQPVDASLLVCLLDEPGVSGTLTAEDLLATLEVPADVERSLHVLPLAGPAVRLRSTSQGGASEDLPLPAPVTRVQYLVPVPASRTHLVLTFATTTQPVVDQLTLLFDAMAESLGFD